MSERDVTRYAHRDEEGNEVLSDALCAVRIGQWCVLGFVVPHERCTVLGGPPAWETDEPWSVTHTASGYKAAVVGDVWRGILWCEELERAFEGKDPRSVTDGAAAIALYTQAKQAVEAREAALRARFGAADDPEEEDEDDDDDLGFVSQDVRYTSSEPRRKVGTVVAVSESGVFVELDGCPPIVARAENDN